MDSRDGTARRSPERVIGKIAQPNIAALQREVQHVERSAERIARMGATAQPGTDTVSISSAAQSAAAAPPIEDIADALVNLNVSKYAFVANLRVLQSADEMSQALLDTFKK